MRQRLGVCVASAIVAGLGFAPRADAAPITLTSTVAQSGANTTIGNGPLAVTAPSGYAFTGQPYASLSSITDITVALTLFDADSALGNLDLNKLTLGLDGIDTGILLNGFRDGFTDTLTVSGTPAAATIPSLLAALHTDGRLVGSIFSTDHPSNNSLGAPATSSSTVSITGEGANWTLMLDNPDQSGRAGSTLLYTGTIMNGTGAELFLNLANINFVTAAPASSYVKDYADEFLATLGIIPVTGYSGQLFWMEWLTSAPAGASGAGTFELTADSPAAPAMQAARFTAAATDATTVVPEPGSVLLTLSGLTWLMVRRRTRRG